MINWFYLILLVTLSFTALSQPNNGLVASFSFNHGNVNDDLGKQHAKVYYAALTNDRFGNANSAYFFYGNAASYINLGTSAVLKPKTGTISLWANTYGILGLGKGVETNPLIITGADTAMDCNEAYYIGYDLNTRKINGATVNDCNAAATLYSKEKMILNSWYHIAITYNSTTLKLYINGVLEDSTFKKFETRFLEGDSVIVGSYNRIKNVRFFLGCIDDIEIYNRVLLPGEIKRIYDAPDPNNAWVYTKRVLYVAGILVLVLLFVLIIKFFIKRALNKEKEKNLLLNQSYEYEIKVLKAQMNPHFIFNSLNTIQQFVITDEKEKARIYLSKFGKLIRKLLLSNTADVTSLKDEIGILEGYLEIEALRFNNVFVYRILVDENVSSLDIKIPHFLIQPFVENAIWHGLLHKDEGLDKRLTVTFKLINENVLSCVIDDNGIGRKPDGEDKDLEKGKPLAINFIKQRLELISRIRNINYGVEIIDKFNEEGTSEGTSIVLAIPIIND